MFGFDGVILGDDLFVIQIGHFHVNYGRGAEQIVRSSLCVYNTGV